MKHLLYLLLLTLAAPALSAQCSDFMLETVECNPDAQLVTYTQNPPPDWFGETFLYLVNATTQDTTFQEDLIFTPSGELSVTGLTGTFTLVLEYQGLCVQTIELDLPGLCGFGTCDLAVTIEDQFSNGCDCEATLVAEVTGGTPPYTYQWSDGNTTNNCPNQCRGTFTVTVTDSEGCAATAEGTVFAPEPFGLTSTVTDASCGDACDGTIVVEAFGGTEPYFFVFDGVVVSQPNISDLCPGDYELSATDANGCVQTQIFVIERVLDVDYEVSVVLPSCGGECDGAITVLNPDNDDITISWETGQTGLVLENLCAGNYFGVVTTPDGCTGFVSASLFDPQEISVSVTDDSVPCGNECSGQLTTFVTGGTPPYTYFWDNAMTTDVVQGLCPGVYTVTVTDANGCEAQGVGTVLELETLVATVQRSGGDCDDTGQVYDSRIVSTGGTGSYTYTFTSEFGTVTTDQADGWPDVPPFTIFDVSIEDGNGCSTALVGVTRERLNLFLIDDEFDVLNSCQSIDVLWPEGFALEGESTEQVVLPSGDTVSYVPGEIPVEEGSYFFISTSADESCRNVYERFVLLRDLPEDIDVTINYGSVCATGTCVRLAGGSNPIEFFGNLEIFVTSPSGATYPHEDGLEICGLSEAGTHAITITDGCTTVNLFVEIEEVTPVCGSVSGVLYSTTDINCGPLPDAVPIPFTVVQVSSPVTGESYFTITDAEGFYTLAVPAGPYLVVPFVNGNPPDYDCATGDVEVPADGVFILDLYVPGELQCPEMEVDICMWQQRRCFQNSLSLYYYNAGNLPAENAVLTLELDEYYTDISADFPFTQVGQTLIFELGDVPFCSFGYINVYFTISCDAPLGEIHCVNASITPDGFCQPAPAWNGSLVNITDVSCDGDSVRFAVSNVGDGPMTVPLSYVVVEDGIMMSGQPLEMAALDPGEVTEIAVLAEGGVYQLLTNQEPAAPTSNDPSALIDACNGEVTISGLDNILTLGNGVPWQETVCRENIGSWDPNDKRGFPLGHSGNMIAPGTRLDYNIRFQNTGTDTAFTVVIRDTISKDLDLSTFRIGAASHPFRMSLDSNRALTFTFDNIMLPDSTTDLVGSNGAISFSIDHDPGLEPGDLVENQAAIYFDFNEPVITNVSTHMIETKPLPTSLRRLAAQRIPLSVFPNPVTEKIFIRPGQTNLPPTDVFVVTDLYGRDLARLPASQRADGILVSELPTGYYFLTLTDAAGRAKGRTSFIVTH